MHVQTCAFRFQVAIPRCCRQGLPKALGGSLTCVQSLWVLPCLRGFLSFTRVTRAKGCETDGPLKLLRSDEVFVNYWWAVVGLLSTLLVHLASCDEPDVVIDCITAVFATYCYAAPNLLRADIIRWCIITRESRGYVKHVGLTSYAGALSPERTGEVSACDTPEWVHATALSEFCAGRKGAAWGLQ